MTKKEKTRRPAHNGHQTETPDVSHIRNPEVTHEKSDVNVRGVLTFVLALTIAGIAIHLGVWALFGFFNQQEAREETPRGPMVLRPDDKNRLPPEPRLQGARGFAVRLDNGEKPLELSAPQSEYRALRLQWEENLRTGLKDQSGKVVGMPIEEAMKKIGSEGLPSSVKSPGGKLQDYAIGLPTAASSGRETEKLQ
jgi:hypothetical protein